MEQNIDLSSPSHLESQPNSLAEFSSYWQLTPHQIGQFQIYAELLLATQKTRNLISNNTIEHVWTRHFHDSAQLWSILKNLDHAKEYQPNHESDKQIWLVDIGTGAGFPGLVLAILSGKLTHLVESNPHKAAFLQQIIMTLNLENVILHQKKIFLLENIQAKFISARALAPLTDLLRMAWHIKNSSIIGNKLTKKPQKSKSENNFTLIFPKGKTWQEEMNLAKKEWKIHFHTVKSITSHDSEIIIIKEFNRVTK